MLADPTQPRPLGPAALQDGPGVRIPERARAGQQLALDPALERAQRVAHDAVVVLARGVTGDAAQPAVAALVARGLVAQGDAHDRPEVRQDAPGIGAPLAISGG